MVCRTSSAVLLLLLLGVLVLVESAPVTRRENVADVSEDDEADLIMLINEAASDETMTRDEHTRERVRWIESLDTDTEDMETGDTDERSMRRDVHMGPDDDTYSDDDEWAWTRSMQPGSAEHVGIPHWMAAVPNLVSLVLRDHVLIRQLADTYHNASGAEKVVAARRLIASLMLHDRRERTLLYPLAARVMGDTVAVQMRNEHNEMLLKLLPMVRGNLADEHTQATLDATLTRVLAHLREEENTVLPRLRQVLQNNKQTNTRLVALWMRLRYTGMPLVTELVRAEHAMAFSLVRGFLSALDSEQPNKAAALAQRMLAHSAQHRRCESDSYYPLVRELAGDGLVRSLNADHEKMTMIEKMLRTEGLSVKNFNNMVLKLLRLKIAHVAKENSMLLPVSLYLINHPDENEALVTKYLNCEMARVE